MVRTVDLAEMLGDFEHQAVAPFLVSSALRIAGRWPSNCTSTTAPMTWVMCPTVGLVAILVHCGFLVSPVMAVSIASFALRGCVTSASAPEMISISSLVIIAWRVRL